MNLSPHQASVTRAAAAESVFSRILVGVDGTEPGFEACRQAAQFAETGASIEAVSVVHLSDAIHAGWNANLFADEMRRDAEVALDKAIAILGDSALRKFINGYVSDALLHEIERTHATTVAIGSHGHRRTAEIMFGGVAGDVLHRAPCSVLIARPPLEGAAFPSSIVVGVDGSPQSNAALEVAARMACRFAASLRVVVGLRGKDVDPEELRRLAPHVDLVDMHPVEALDAEAQRNDLLVVGSRGLHGLRSLGSVSERVAHRARCSVLVVRMGQSA
jgi:nucleotide-binding universal stress UspA family protein